MVINQGDVFWVDLGMPSGSGPGYMRPHVVASNNAFNLSAIGTVVLCAITSNVKRANAPGNVLLRKGESNLSKKSVVNISQIVTVDKRDVKKKIGTLSKSRLQEVLNGIALLLEPREI